MGAHDRESRRAAGQGLPPSTWQSLWWSAAGGPWACRAPRLRRRICACLAIYDSVDTAGAGRVSRWLLRNQGMTGFASSA
jgi:hypothetical protein